MLNCFLVEKFYLHYAVCDFDSILLHCTKLFIRQSIDREQIFDVFFETPPIEKSCVRHWVDMTEWNQRKKKDWYYPDIESARRPVPHCTEVPVPVFTFLPDLTADEPVLEAMEDSNSCCSNCSSISVAAEASSP